MRSEWNLLHSLNALLRFSSLLTPLYSLLALPHGQSSLRRHDRRPRFAAILIDPPRDALRAAIATRWAAMLAGGAVDEVRTLVAQGLDPALPAMRAHGVPELANVVNSRGRHLGQLSMKSIIAAMVPPQAGDSGATLQLAA